MYCSLCAIERVVSAQVCVNSFVSITSLYVIEFTECLCIHFYCTLYASYNVQYIHTWYILVPRTLLYIVHGAISIYTGIDICMPSPPRQRLEHSADTVHTHI